jgi:hypothetical protein
MPRAGWPIVGVAVVVTASVVLGAMHLDRRRRPELWVFFSSAISVQALVAIAAVLSQFERAERRRDRSECGRPSTAAVTDEATTQHLRGLQHRLRRRVGGHPHDWAPPVGCSDLEHAPARVRRMVDGMDIRHHRPDRLPAAQAADTRGREAAPQRLDRAGRARLRQHSAHVHRRRAVVRKHDRSVRQD